MNENQAQLLLPFFILFGPALALELAIAFWALFAHLVRSHCNHPTPQLPPTARGNHLLNTLLIAPDSNLINIPDETRHIQEALGAQVINGRVTPIIVADAISNRIARRQKIDVLFFIGHGSLTGLQLTDGHISIAELCRYVKSANIRYLVLNTCESEYIALAIHHETDATVICTIAQVDDMQAYATSRLLAEAIASGYPIEEAYERAKPSGAGPSQYRIILNCNNGNHRAAKEFDTEHQTIMLMRAMLEEQFEKYERSLSELKTIVRDEREQRQKSIEAITDNIRKLITDMEELKVVQSTTVILPNNYKTVYAFAFVAIFVPVAVFFSDFRDAIGISAPLGYAFSFLFYAISYSLFAYLYGFIANRSKKP